MTADDKVTGGEVRDLIADAVEKMAATVTTAMERGFEQLNRRLDRNEANYRSCATCDAKHDALDRELAMYRKLLIASLCSLAAAVFGLIWQAVT